MSQKILWRLTDVAVISKDGELINHCSPKATTELLRLKIVRVININPFTIQMNCDYKNQIQEAEDLVKEKADRKKIIKEKADKKYYEKRKIKRAKEKLQPIKKSKR